jgi:hypothetical protein
MHAPSISNFSIRAARRWWLLIWVCLASHLIHAQWTTQTILLQPGWNAVWLEVQPEPRDTDTVFAGLPVESVWCWNRRFTTAQFLQDANNLLPGQPDWLSYYPPGQGNSALSSLFAVHAGRCYLIKSTANQPVSWRVQGRPAPVARDWIAGSLNLVGFPIDPQNPPSFSSFFAPSPAHAGQAILRLLPNGNWQSVTNPATARLRPNEAFWIFTAGASTYNGPLGVASELRAGIDFGQTLPETYITLKNPSAVAKTVVVTPTRSEAAPVSSGTAVAGEVPLSYRQRSLASQIFGWFPLTNALVLNLGPGQSTNVYIAVRRPDLVPYSLIPGITNYQYQSLLTIIDGQGTVLRLPVTCSGGEAVRTGRSTLRLADTTEPIKVDSHAGLWVGSAVIQAVSEPASDTNPLAPRPTGSPTQFRLIVHVDASGRQRLLQHVTLMWANGPAASEGETVVPGQQVLVANDKLLPNFRGAALRDGIPVGRRISTVAFSHAAPIPFSGAFGDDTLPMNATVVLGYDDPLNPFKHRFHPDHDNLDASFSQVLPEGIESFTVRRDIQLAFSSTDLDGLVSSQYGGEIVGGRYTEIVSGLHRNPIVVQGTFRLSRVSLITTLDNIP